MRQNLILLAKARKRFLKQDDVYLSPSKYYLKDLFNTFTFTILGRAPMHESSYLHCLVSDTNYFVPLLLREILSLPFTT